jgi:hypothetical protein
MLYEFPPFRLDTADQCLLQTGPSGNEVRTQLPPKAFSILECDERDLRGERKCGRALAELVGVPNQF